MSGAVGSCDILLRNVPGDVAQELARRAEVNFRSRMYEAIAILAAVCRGHVALPVSMDGATLAAVKPADDVLPDDGPIRTFGSEPLPSDAFEKPYTQDDATQGTAGGEAI